MNIIHMFFKNFMGQIIKKNVDKTSTLYRLKNLNGILGHDSQS